jgi:hypothetical protein
LIPWTNLDLFLGLLMNRWVKNVEYILNHT